MSSPHTLAPLTAALVATALCALPVRASEAPPHALDCASAMAADCRFVLPGAVRFAPVAGKPYQTGYDAADAVAGWVILSTDTVSIKGYSGKPLATLVGLDPQARITGARVIHHSEPILLVGIPAQALTDFVAFYAGKPAITQVVVGASADPDVLTVDVISGATVTALAENQTILESARHLGLATGVLAAEALNPGHFVTSDRPLTWHELVDSGVLGRLTVREAEMGSPGSDTPFIDLYFTVADAPQVGRALLGDREYAYLMGRVGEGEHLVIILGAGSSSFKGSAFVRGGLFDRVRIEQGLRTIMFRDTDYANVGAVAAVGAPTFAEGAAFVTRGGRLDPGAPFDLVFTGSVYNGSGGFSRDFHSFKTRHRLPPSVYVVDGGDRDLGAELTAQAWYNQRYEVGVLSAWLVLLLGLFAARRWLTADMRRLQALHLAALVVSFVGLGLVLNAQPSITQVLTLVGAAVTDFDLNLFMTEPVLFVFWIYIALTVLLWGRGVFCGWTCPYGAMSELLFRLGRKLGLAAYELPDRVHTWARFGRYVVLAVLLPAFLISPETGEKLAEIEPFKSTFFVHAWDREALFLIWWLVLLVPALFVYRPFCRYLCPLGASLALPSSARASGPLRRQFCSKCTICTRGCEPRAIREDGSIDPRECLSCMECEANYRAPTVCPPLIAIDRLRIGGGGPPGKREQLDRDAKRVRRLGRHRAS